MTMTRHTLTFTGILLSSVAFSSVQATENLKLQYNAPAKDWNEALPIGNGSLGAMLHGGVGKMVIDLNEDTLWSGEPSTVLHAPPSYFLAMKKAAKLLAEGKYAEGDELMRTRGLGKLGQAYQPVGSLQLDFHTGQSQSAVSRYHRTLDLTSAIHTVTYQKDGVSYMRETFASFPDKVIYIRLSADREKAIHFTATKICPI